MQHTGRCLWHTFNLPSWNSRKTRARQSTSQSFIAVVQAGLAGHREDGRGRQVRFFTGTCRLRRQSLDIQLHPEQRQGATKKEEKNLCIARLSTPYCSGWKCRLQSPLLAKSVNLNLSVNRLHEREEELCEKTKNKVTIRNTFIAE